MKLSHEGEMAAKAAAALAMAIREELAAADAGSSLETPGPEALGTMAATLAAGLLATHPDLEVLIDRA